MGKFSTFYHKPIVYDFQTVEEFEKFLKDQKQKGLAYNFDRATLKAWLDVNPDLDPKIKQQVIDSYKA